MNDILPVANFIGLTRAITPDSTSIRVFLCIWVLIVLSLVGVVYGIRFCALELKGRHGDASPYPPAAVAVVSAFVLVFSILWGINFTALSSAKQDAEEAAKTAKEERHTKTFAYHAIGDTISAESSIYAAEGTYTDAFPDLVGAEPGLNRFLVDDLVPKKQLELGAGGKSVMIEYTFYGMPPTYGGQTLNVYLTEGAVTVAGCHAASWMGCKNGHWDPGAPSSGR